MKFDDNGIPYNAPLSASEKFQYPSGFLPSGEANYFDFAQDRSYHKTSGINAIYPSPTGIPVQNGIFVKPKVGGGFEASGIYPTYPQDVDPVEKSGIFDFENLSSRFSNVSQVSGLKIESFEIFNPYIHYYRSSKKEVVRIPYISTYKLSVSFDPYKR